MFLDIDIKPRNRRAIIDESKTILTYGDIYDFCNCFCGIIDKRQLVFCLCENAVGALLGYLSLYENKDVSLLLSVKIDTDLLQKLIDTYHPAYMWMPIQMSGRFGYKEVYSAYNYGLYKTDYLSPEMNENLSFLLTTSGSTGSPKLVRHKYGNLEVNARNVSQFFGWVENEHSICDLPMQYTMGLNVINSTLYVGGTVLLMNSSLTDPRFWSFIKEHKGTNFTGVPYSYEILLKLQFQKMQLSDLNTIAEGGGKLTDDIFNKLSEYAQNNKKRFFATFGTTETSARLAYLPPELASKKCGSIGRAIPEGNLSLVNDDGNNIQEVEAEGELVYRGPNVTMGYAENQADLLLPDVFCGEYKTGDIARRDADGCYYIVGRKKRFLKIFGLRISLDQTERIISEGFNISCACVGNDDKLFVFVEGNVSTDAVKKYVSEKTGLIGTVFDIQRIEKIPRNESGKTDYQYLRKSAGL